jgi:hypothetical protein
MINLILLQISMIFQYVILNLDISLNLANVSFGITLSFISELRNLLIEILFDTFLQREEIFLSLFSDFY